MEKIAMTVARSLMSDSVGKFTCKSCGRSVEVKSAVDLKPYLVGGYPTCCGSEMELSLRGRFKEKGGSYADMP